MSLWLLRNITSLGDNRYAFVVRAEDETSARALAVAADDNSYGDTVRFWNNPKYTACHEITVNGEPTVILDAATHVD